MYPNVYYSFDVIYKKCILNDISWRQIKIIYMIRNAVCLETLIIVFHYVWLGSDDGFKLHSASPDDE
jgi:hypothetical protein